MATQQTITITFSQLAKMIDHSLLHPTMTDNDVVAGLEIARKYNVAAACVKPYLVSLAKKHLGSSDVKVCAVIGFPHGNSRTEVKVAEAIAAGRGGGAEIDMVINISEAFGGDWAYVTEEIRCVNDVVRSAGALFKVIFENDYLRDEHIARLCKICTALEVEFVKTSTGYGFVKLPNGLHSYKGATVPPSEADARALGP
jgi:deoxyribose-phosphate aldolase